VEKPAREGRTQLTKRKTAGELVDGATRNLRAMRQHRDGLAEGSISDTDIEVMALRRVLGQVGADEGGSAGDQLGGMAFWNTYCVQAGEPLFAGSYNGGAEVQGLPSWTHDLDPVEGLTTDPADLSGRYYDVYLHRESGRPKGVYVDLDHWS
jgi:hypothetical protein